jgi:hypothetical protein
MIGDTDEADLFISCPVYPIAPMPAGNDALRTTPQNPEEILSTEKNLTDSDSNRKDD